MRKPDQKTVTVGTQTAAALWAKLAEETREQTPPANSKTAREFATESGMAYDASRKMLSRLVDSKKAVATPVRRVVGGQMRHVIYYTLKA